MLCLPPVAAAEREAALAAESLPDVSELATTAVKAAVPPLAVDGAAPRPAGAAELARHTCEATLGEAFVADAAASAALAAASTIAVD